jgi:HlyD family secretion protein
MEARVDVGEMDVVGIKPGHKARLEVDAFKDRKFSGTVTDVASSSKDNNQAGNYSSSSSSQSQEATKFQVRIRLNDKEAFRPGMSVSADIETEYRTNVLTVPLASVTTRLPTPPKKTDPSKTGSTNTTADRPGTNAAVSSIVATNGEAPDKKSKESSKMLDVVFAVDGNHVDAVPVKIGICDDNYWEITDGLTNGQEIVSGGYRAISRDLDDGKKIRKGPATTETAKKD